MKLRKNQQGFALVTAIFLLTVLAALGTVMVRLSGTSHFTVINALQGARAYYAARSALEWGTVRAIGGSCAAATTFTINTADQPFIVTVTCSSTNHQEKSDSYNIYTLTATAETQGSAYGTQGYASRQVSATVTDAP